MAPDAVPLAHTAQLGWPPEGWNEPDLQLEHAAAPFVEANLPAVQGEQTEESEGENRPAAHEPDMADDEQKEPAGQEVHADAAAALG